MVDKYSSPTPKWQCLTAWNPWPWAPSEIATGCYKTSFLLFANARGAGTLLTAKYPAPGTHHATNAWGLPGGRGGYSQLEGTVCTYMYHLVCNDAIMYCNSSHDLFLYVHFTWTREWHFCNPFKDIHIFLILCGEGCTVQWIDLYRRLTKVLFGESFTFRKGSQALNVPWFSIYVQVLALVAYTHSFEIGQTFRSIQTDVTLLANNTQQCCDLLRLFSCTDS